MVRPLKDKTLAYLLLLAWFLGVGGVHRLYLGKWVTGIIWLLTLGLFGIGQFIDLFLTSGMVDRENARRIAEGY
ncbi:MAG: NINE protein [Planctomycetota bacterium]